MFKDLLSNYEYSWGIITRKKVFKYLDCLRLSDGEIEVDISESDWKHLKQAVEFFFPEWEE